MLCVLNVSSFSRNEFNSEVINLFWLQGSKICNAQSKYNKHGSIDMQAQI